jgi:DNA (cytosine-5)-methyltransferase 1
MVAVDVAPTVRAGAEKAGGDRPYGTDVDTCDSLAVVHAIQAGALRTNPNSGPDGVGVQEGVAYTLEARAEVQAVAFAAEVAPTLGKDSYNPMKSSSGQMVDFSIATTSAVRRLTPVECERLQGFPDHYTDIPWRGKPTSPDGPRYKALGNSWAVPKFVWLGQRIQKLMPVVANENNELKDAA